MSKDFEDLIKQFIIDSYQIKRIKDTKKNKFKRAISLNGIDYQYLSDNNEAIEREMIKNLASIFSINENILKQKVNKLIY